MKIIFLGTGHFAVPSLQSLVNFCQQSHVHQLIGVYTQPDRPKGRGQVAQHSPIKQCANTYQLPVYQPFSLISKAIQKDLALLAPDVIVVADYGLLLPSAVLRIPQKGCINVHASLLPRWRGAAPIQRAILEGDTVTGITIMGMDKGLDTGPIILQAKEAILPTDTAITLEAKLASLGARCLMTVVQRYAVNEIVSSLQPTDGVCYADKLTKQEGWVDWSLPSIQIDRQIRAFNPWPVSTTSLNGMRLRIWKATPLEDMQHSEKIRPGEIIEITPKSITVATGKGSLLLHALQREGGRCLPVSDLLNGALSQVTVGMCFHSVSPLFAS